MTSDAKIGLLLGLVFIFVIAFIINGLPGFHHKDDGNKLTTNMVGLSNNPSGLGANERKVLEPAPEAIPVSGIGQPAASAAGSTNARYTMALPQNTPEGQTAASAEPVAAAPATVEPIAPAQPQPVASVSNPPTESASPAQPALVKTAPATKPSSTKQTSLNTYVVQDGDTLGAIAKKVYGPEQGNKLSNIEAIFEANRKTLSAIDALKVGQKLTIPPVASSASNTPASALSGSNFAKVDSVGQRHTPASTEKPAAANKPAQATKADNSKPGKVYVVKEGDSLWQIASEQLGDGNRYKEIVKLNSDILSSEDDIQVDMKLKLPAK
jgi:nucleoid-associated protein YgaU